MLWLVCANFSFLFKFLEKRLSANSGKPHQTPHFVGVWSGFVLSAYVPQKER